MAEHKKYNMVEQEKSIYDQIIKISESIPHVEPTQPLIMGSALFCVLKSARDFVCEAKPGMSTIVTATIGSITIVCDGFIKYDDPNIYQFKDGKLTIVAMVEGLDNIY